MKYYILIIVIFLSLKGISQDRYKCFSVFTYSDPSATLKDGFNIGAGIDYRMNLIYLDAQVFYFPKLRGKDYLEITGTILGFNFFDKPNYENWRFAIGTKLGMVFRENIPSHLYGLEGSIQYNIPKTSLYIGLESSYDNRNDGKVWEQDAESYWRFSNFAKIGFRY